MTTQTLELQAVTDEELLGAAGGHFPTTPQRSVTLNCST
jgi:hypothetical protein